jgi:hypothetical protein
MSYTVLNGAAYHAAVKRAMAHVATRFETKIRYAMQATWIHAAKISPTYSGDFSESWNVSVGQPDTSFVNTQRLQGAPIDKWSGVMGNFSMPIGFLGRYSPELPSQPIYLSNSASHDEPYAWKIESGKINFRDVNIGKDRVAFKASRFFKSQFGV